MNKELTDTIKDIVEILAIACGATAVGLALVALMEGIAGKI